MSEACVEFQELCRIAKENNLAEFKISNVNGVYSAKLNAQIELSPTIPIELPQDSSQRMPTEDEMLLWSTNSFPENDKTLK